MKISFVIPCYNSSQTIEGVVEEIRSTMKCRPEFCYEIILVNDFSKDHTAQVIKNLAQRSRDVKAISLARNFGQPSAILAGFHYVTGDYVVTLDDDGQTPIQQIFEFIDKLEEEQYDVVCAKYVQRAQPSGFRRLGSKLNEKMSDWLIKKPKGVYMSAFLCARRFVVDEIVRYKNSYPYLAGLVLRTTQNIGNVEVVQRERSAGTSNYNFKKLLQLWLNGFTAFSIKPLRISVIVGMGFAFCGFLVAAAAIIRKLLGVDVQVGWSSIIALMLIIGGVILLFLGMIGEYIGRIYMCINESPQYVIREVTIGGEANEEE